MENENENENFNIIIIGKYKEEDKNMIIELYGNPKKSELKLNDINIDEEKDIECYTRQFNEKIFKGVRIIVLKNFDIKNENKNNLFQILMEQLNRKGLICFHLTEDEKINILQKIIEYSIESYDHPLFTFIEKKENKNELIKMKYNLYKRIKTIDCKIKSNAIYSKRIQFINEKYIIHKLLRDYHIFNYINNKEIITQFGLQQFNEKPTINLMICGRKRSGKSSLVNLLLGEEISYADSGNSVTNCIRECNHKKYNLTIFDTIGFDKEDNENINNNVNNVIKSIKDFSEENQICYKKKIHLFLFCINRNSGFIDKDDKTFLEFLINEEENKNNKIIIIFTHVHNKSQKKNTKREFEKQLKNLKIALEKKEELKSNSIYLDLFDSSVEDFQALLDKILNILEPEIEKLKSGDIKNFKNSIFWGKLEKTEDIKNKVKASIKKYIRLSFLSAYIPIPFLDIFSEYQVREYMFDKIAEIYQELLEEKIPDAYQDPDVRKIVAKASKYTYLKKDGSFYPLEKYQDIYEKLKKKDYDSKKDDNKIINDNTDIELEPLILDERNNKKEKNENQEEKPIENIHYMQMKKKFEEIYFKKEEGINVIKETNCSKLKGFANITNDVLKTLSTISGIGIKQIVKYIGKEINVLAFGFGIPIVGHAIFGSIFGAVNISSLENKINIIINEIDGSLSVKEKEKKLQNN